MKKKESADQTRPAPSPGSTRTRRESALLSGTPSAGLRRLLRLRFVPGREDGLLAVLAEAALQFRRPLFRLLFPPVEGVLRGRLDGPQREALRDRARVADEAAARVVALGRGPDREVAPLLDLLLLQEGRAHPRETRVAAARRLAGVEHVTHADRG